MDFKKQFKEGLLTKNPVLVQLLGMCSTLAITTIMGYTAMSGAIGGGGLGKIAIMIGYNRYKYAVLYLAVIVLVILVQILQSFGTWLSRKCDKRLRH